MRIIGAIIGIAAGLFLIFGRRFVGPNGWFPRKGSAAYERQKRGEQALAPFIGLVLLVFGVLFAFGVVGN